jgi:hypothetical protein
VLLYSEASCHAMHKLKVLFVECTESMSGLHIVRTKGMDSCCIRTWEIESSKNLLMSVQQPQSHLVL